MVASVAIPNSSTMPNKRDALFNSFSSVTARAIAGLSRLGVLLLIAGHYGPDLFGKISLALSMMEIFRSFSEFGLDTVSLRRFSQLGAEQRSKLLGHVIISKTITAAVFYCISQLVIVTLAHDRVEIELGAIAGLSLFSGNIVGALSSYYQSQLRMKFAVVPAICGFGVYVCASMAAIHFDASLLILLAMLPAAELIYAAMLRYRCIDVPILRHDLAVTVALFRESFPLGIMSAVIFLYMRLDNIVVFRILGGAALGLYAISCRIVEPATMVPVAFATSLLSVLSGLSQRDQSLGEMFRVATLTLWPAYLFVAVCTTVLVVWGEVLLRHFSPNYVAAYPALRILAFVLLIRTVNITLTGLINSRGQYAALARITLSNLIVNVLLVFALVRPLGIVGAAWAAFGTELWNMLAQWRCLSNVVTLGQPRLHVTADMER